MACTGLPLDCQAHRDRCVLFMKWVGAAWQETSCRLKDTVIRSFVKCGISLPISGSRGSEINIDGLPDYRMVESDDIEEIEFFTDAEDESMTHRCVLVCTPYQYLTVI